MREVTFLKSRNARAYSKVWYNLVINVNCEVFLRPIRLLKQYLCQSSFHFSVKKEKKLKFTGIFFLFFFVVTWWFFIKLYINARYIHLKIYIKTSKSTPKTLPNTKLSKIRKKFFLRKKEITRVLTLWKLAFFFYGQGSSKSYPCLCFYNRHWE